MYVLNFSLTLHDFTFSLYFQLSCAYHVYFSQHFLFGTDVSADSRFKFHHELKPKNGLYFHFILNYVPSVSYDIMWHIKRRFCRTQQHFTKKSASLDVFPTKTDLHISLFIFPMFQNCIIFNIFWVVNYDSLCRLNTFRFSYMQLH